MSNKWISVKEDLPKEGGRYWCYLEHINSLSKSHFQWNCSYDAITKTFSDRSLNDGETVTYWQPLPNPPEEEPKDHIPDVGNMIGEAKEPSPNLTQSTENLSKIKNKDEWLNEVKILKELNWLWQIFDEAKEHGAANVVLGRIKIYDKGLLGNKESISEDELIDEFEKYLEFFLAEDNRIRGLSESMAIIAKRHANSKLEELEKWCGEQFKHADALDKQEDTETRYWGGKKDGISLAKNKISSLK